MVTLEVCDRCRLFVAAILRRMVIGHESECVAVDGADSCPPRPGRPAALVSSSMPCTFCLLTLHTRLDDY